MESTLRLWWCNRVLQPRLSGEQVTTGGSRRSLHGEAINIEHAYPAQWLAEANGCPNRNECEVEAFDFAEADLHNLWPAVSRINSSRSNLAFGEIPGEDQRRFEGICLDYERTSGTGAIVEPRDDAKGDLAR